MAKITVEEKSVLLNKYENIKGYSSNLFDNEEWREFDAFCGGYNLAVELLNEKANEPEEIFIVRWFHNDNDDVVCANKEIAEKYIEDYNSRSGFKSCYVETCYPLDAPTR